MITTADELVASVAAARGGSTAEQQQVVTDTAPGLIERILHAQVGGADGADGSGAVFGTGAGVFPGAASGRVYFTADDALDAFDRGEDIVLMATETTPADEPAMRIAAALVTARGGVASHTAVVARGLGTPAVCGVEGLVCGGDEATCGDQRVQAGDTVVVDGVTGTVTLGGGTITAAEPPTELFELLAWADGAAGVAVRANADTAADAARAIELGAVGVGLCRTEHMFLGDRLPIIQRALTAAPEDAHEAVDELIGQQRADFLELFEALGAAPITVRLLDAPLHEFMPPGSDHAEHNPMLGLRGVRMAILRPDILNAQLTALAQAIEQATTPPSVEVLIPLVVTLAEFRVVVDQVHEVFASHGVAGRVAVGAMIETPRAALIADQIASVADFVSFGTNDLTQMTFGFSRDDVEQRVIPRYLEQGLLGANPFATLDVDGVGELVAQACSAVRAEPSATKIGVCGEHGGDPASIRFFVELGVDYVSCSPFRVPVARLVAGQAALAASTG